MTPPPLTPAELRRHLAEQAQAHAAEVFPFGRVGPMRKHLERLVGNRERRHELTQALFREPSMSRLLSPELWALWAWLDPQPVEGGLEWTVRVHCQAEALAVLAEYAAEQRQAQADAGQLGLL